MRVFTAVAICVLGMCTEVQLKVVQNCKDCSISNVRLLLNVVDSGKLLVNTIYYQ